MSFLKKNVKKRENYLRKDEEIPEQTLGEEFLSLIIYLFATVTYFIKKNMNKIVILPFLLLFLIYVVYKRYFSGNKETEMIDGMEVPKLKDNYDLSID